MEIFNRIEPSIQKVQSIDKKQKKNEVSFSSSEKVSSSDAVASMAKAKIMLDNVYSKPIPYETKLKMLEERKISEKDNQIFLSVDDKTFAEMIGYVDAGLTAENINSVYNSFWGSETSKKAAELAKFNIPYGFARDLYSYSSVSDEKIEFLKKAKFDFSPQREYFKVDEYALKRVLRDENEFNKFNSLYSRGVDANLALYSLHLRDNELERLNKTLEENKTLSNSATAAYCMGSVSLEDTKKIQELAKKHKLDANDYDFWLPVVKARDIKRTGELLDLGVPVDCLKNHIVLNDEQVTDALNQAEIHKISAADSINIYQRTDLVEERRKIAYDLLNKEKMTPQLAINLSQFDVSIIAEKAADYIARGLEYYNATCLAHLDKSDEEKEKIISLLPVFKDISQSQTFVESNFSEEDSAKVLELAHRGANLYLAKFCLETPACYEKAKEIIDSNPEISLAGVYGGWEPELLKNLDLLSIGVPSDDLSFFSYSAKPEDIELLKSGVKYSEFKKLKEYEEKGTDVSGLIPFLQKGVKFSTASDIHYNKLPFSDVPVEIVMQNLIPELESDNADKIMELAKLQHERGDNWISAEEKETLVAFLAEMDEVRNISKFYDLGFINEKALENYKELKKRGLSQKNSDTAIILSQIEYEDSAQFDRVSEMIKRKVPFEKILFAMSDDKSFINAINSSRNSEYSGNNITLSSHLLKFYNAGLNYEQLSKIAKECPYLDDEEYKRIGEYINKGHTVDDSIKISMYTSYKPDTWIDPEVDYEKTAERREFYSNYILKGCSYDYLYSISYSEEKIQKFTSLIEQGFEPALAQKMVVCGINPNNEKKIARIKELEKSTIHEDLKKFAGNPTLYSTIDKLYDFNNYSVGAFSNLVNSDISLSDLFASAKTFIKSPLKQAMKRPNLYLADIPLEHTEKVNGQYPTLPPDILASYQDRMISFFKMNMGSISRMLKYLDVDTFNQMMDKRTSIFSEELNMLDKLDNKHYELVSKLTKCRKDNGKLLSSKEKIDLSKIVLYHKLGYIDISYLEDIVRNGTVSVSELNDKIFETLMQTIGLTPKEVEAHSDKLDFDKDYMFLLLRTQKTADFALVKEALDDNDKRLQLIHQLQELLKTPEELAHNGLTEENATALLDLLQRADTMEEKDVFNEFCVISPFASVDITAQDVAKLAILKDFKEHIQHISNPFGRTNAKTKAKFKKLGLDYDKWLNYPQKTSIEFNGRNYDIKLWDRKPQKDLFMGNRTSCCTAIIEGGNGKATPIYLSNTAFNVVEMTDENGNIVAMSRIFLGNVEEKPSVIIENIEINNAFLKNRDEAELKELRDKMFGYIGNLASSISDGKEIPIYFSKNYTHVPLSDFETVKKNIDFIGDISSEKVYLNCAPGWVNPSELKKQSCELYLVS